MATVSSGTPGIQKDWLPKVFWSVLLGTLVLKFWIAYEIPMTGDEAYHLTWGRFLDWGYYDHPPMTGWINALLLGIGNSQIVLRLPAILLSTILAFFIYWVLSKEDAERAVLTSALFMFSPFHVIPVIMATDTMLILYGFTGILFFYQGIVLRKKRWVTIAGFFFALSFLSKYFALLYIASCISYLALRERNRFGVYGTLILLLWLMPALMIHYFWNEYNCFANFKFNFSSRHVGEVFSLKKAGQYLLFQFYIMTPFLIFFLAKSRIELKRRLQEREVQFFLIVFVVPLVAFFLSSFKYWQGLHWMFGFYPAFYLFLGFVMTTRRLRLSAMWMAGFLLIHIVAFAIITFAPESKWKDYRRYKHYVLFRHTNEIADRINEVMSALPEKYQMASDGYTPAGLMSYHHGPYYAVYGTGSKFGRQDDLVTDFRTLRDKNIAIFTGTPPTLEIFFKYFSDAIYVPIEVRGTEFYLVLGKDFRYERYRADYLTQIRDHYYNFSEENRPAGCPFTKRYFP